VHFNNDIFPILAFALQVEFCNLINFFDPFGLEVVSSFFTPLLSVFSDFFQGINLHWAAVM